MSPKCSIAWSVLSLALLCAAVQQSMAATIGAASCSSSAVQAAISNAQPGDTVSVPAGDCSWGSFTISGGVHVRGAGIGLTNISVNGSVEIKKHAWKNVELSGFSFSKSGGGESAKMFSVTGPWQAEPPLIHDNEFVVNNAGIFRYQTNGGVIFNNVFRGEWDDSGIQHKIDDDDESWSTEDTIGNRDSEGKLNLYVEDNVFEGMVNQGTDFDDGARVVFRHNTLVESSFNSHGLATSPTGIRHFEIYNNSFTYPDDTVNQNWHIWIRGGTGVIFDNDVEDIDGVEWGNKRELLLSVRAAVDGGNAGCCQTWACDHQVGQNHDGNSQFLDPLTIWGNTGTLVHELSDGWSNSCGNDMSDFLQDGRDFVFTTDPKSGYVPYPYPHPLRSIAVRPKEPENLTIVDP